MKSNNLQDIMITAYKFSVFKFCLSLRYQCTEMLWQGEHDLPSNTAALLWEKILATCPIVGKVFSLPTREVKHKLPFNVLPALQHTLQQTQKLWHFYLQSPIFHCLFSSPKYCYFLCILISILHSLILNTSNSGVQNDIKLIYSYPEVLPECAHTCQEGSDR